MAWTWTIDPDRSDGGITANTQDGDMPEYQRGERLSLTFAFWYDSSIDTNQGDHITRYKKARQYLDYAGAGSVKPSINSKPHYVERLPSDATAPSIVVKLVPGSSYTATPGLWVFIRGGDDPTTFPNDTCRLTFETTVLAEASEYKTRSDIEAALKEGVLQ